MKIYSYLCAAMMLLASAAVEAKTAADYVNPFIGTTNFGTTNPGAVSPGGFMSVVPFNVMGSADNKYDKDARWWSTPYEYHNSFFTGFSHVNLSGVGCPELGSLLLMPTTGDLIVNYKEYGSTYKNEQATPGYYSNELTKYGIKCEVSATPRTSIARFTFPAGQSNILMNLGEGLTNESGATVRRVSATEIEGSKLMGTFCYTPQAVFPIYFVMRVSKAPESYGFWKMQRNKTGVEGEWDVDNGKYKLYPKYSRVMSGDDIGNWYIFNTTEGEQIEVQIGISFVSCENARENLDAEQQGFNFDKVRTDAYNTWNDYLSTATVEGGTEDQKTVFYTALYHSLIHPNILQDVNGEYPAMESGENLKTTTNRYTVFSLWDTFRNVHQLQSLLYPERQLDMVRSMVDMYKESGWLPRWELYGRETYVMSGDPAIPVIVDTWLRGLKDFDIDAAYEAMIKSATTPGKDNPLRPDCDPYNEKGYIPFGIFAADLSGDNSVSRSLEYYVADYALSQLAKDLGKKEDAEYYYNRSLGYKKYYCKEFGTLRPITADGKFLSPFNPKQGENFEPSPGFHEGTAWNYTFYVPHDIAGLSKLMGGKKKFVNKLQMVFDEKLYDPANEPNIAYPYIFSAFKGEEWRTDKEVKRLLAEHFTNTPDGIPGNDDTGTMSAWAVFNMMGFYPDCPAKAEYTAVAPTFDKITLTLDTKYYKNDKVVITTEKCSPDANTISCIKIDGKKISGRKLTHEQIVNAKEIKFVLIKK